MKVTVHLHTIYQLQTPEGLVNRLEMDLPEGSSVNNLLSALDLHIVEEETLLVINSLAADQGSHLKDGDHLHIIPAISGGI